MGRRKGQAASFCGSDILYLMYNPLCCLRTLPLFMFFCGVQCLLLNEVLVLDRGSLEVRKWPESRDPTTLRRARWVQSGPWFGGVGSGTAPHVAEMDVKRTRDADTKSCPEIRRVSCLQPARAPPAAFCPSRPFVFSDHHRSAPLPLLSPACLSCLDTLHPPLPHT